MGYWWAITKIDYFGKGLIGAQILNGLCRVLSVVCQQISSVNAHLTLIWGGHQSCR